MQPEIAVPSESNVHVYPLLLCRMQPRKSRRALGAAEVNNGSNVAATGTRKPAVPSHIVPRRAPTIVKDHVAETSEPSKAVAGRVRRAAPRVDSGMPRRRSTASGASAASATSQAGASLASRRQKRRLDDSSDSVGAARPRPAKAGGHTKRRRASGKAPTARQKSVQVLLVSRVKEARAAAALGQVDTARSVLSELASAVPEVRQRSLYWVYAARLEEGQGAPHVAMDLLIRGREAVKADQWEYNNVSQALHALAGRIPHLPSILDSARKRRLAWSAARPALPQPSPAPGASDAPVTEAAVDSPPPVTSPAVPRALKWTAVAHAAETATPPAPPAAEGVVPSASSPQPACQVLDSPDGAPTGEAAAAPASPDVAPSPPPLTSSAIKTAPSPDVAPSPPPLASSAIKPGAQDDVAASPPLVTSAALTAPVARTPSSALPTPQASAFKAPGTASSGASTVPSPSSLDEQGEGEAAETSPAQAPITPSRVMGSVPVFAAVQARPSTAAAMGSPCVAAVVRRSARIAWTAGSKVTGVPPTAIGIAGSPCGSSAEGSVGGEVLLTPLRGRGRHPAAPRSAPAGPVPGDDTSITSASSVLVPQAFARTRQEVLTAAEWAVLPNPAAASLGSPINEHAVMQPVSAAKSSRPALSPIGESPASPGIAGDSASPAWQRGGACSPAPLSHGRRRQGRGGVPPRSPRTPSWCDTVAKFVAHRHAAQAGVLPSDVPVTRATLAGAAHAQAAQQQAAHAVASGSPLKASPVGSRSSRGTPPRRGAPSPLRTAVHPAAEPAVSPRIMQGAAAAADAALQVEVSRRISSSPAPAAAAATAAPTPVSEGHPETGPAASHAMASPPPSQRRKSRRISAGTPRRGGSAGTKATADSTLVSPDRRCKRRGGVKTTTPRRK